jgi:polysaccharide export outer membrane protein
VGFAFSKTLPGTVHLPSLTCRAAPSAVPPDHPHEFDKPHREQLEAKSAGLANSPQWQSFRRMSASVVACLRGRLVLFVAVALLSACGQLPRTGPNSQDIEAGTRRGPAGDAIQIVDIDPSIVQQLRSGHRFRPLAEVLGTEPTPTAIGAGDTLEVTIWEAPPATLFGSGPESLLSPSSSRATTLPAQMVDRDGTITVPFAGRVPAAGRSVQEVERDIVRRLEGKANHPEILVRVTENVSSTVTVVGEVTRSLRMPLTPHGERLLDAVAAAGGVKDPVSKVALQVARGRKAASLPMELVIRDPAENISLAPGDVVTAVTRPLSFSALGATGKNEEIPFEAQGITLAQALARAGGLLDTRSDPAGVFIFRLEAAQAIKWPNSVVRMTPDKRVPVVYRLDLRDPSAFFLMQGFPIDDHDVVYVSNAPTAELQKFLNLVFSLVYPVLNVYQITK